MFLEELWKWFHNFRSSGWFIMNFWSLNQFLELIKGFRKKKITRQATWQPLDVPRVLLTSAWGQQKLISSWRQRWLGQHWPSQRSTARSAGSAASGSLQSVSQETLTCGPHWTCSQFDRWLGQHWPGQRRRHQRPWWCQHLADPVLTSAGHVALSGASTCHAVCFSFSENLLLIPEIILSFRKS